MVARFVSVVMPRPGQLGALCFDGKPSTTFSRIASPMNLASTTKSIASAYLSVASREIKIMYMQLR